MPDTAQPSTANIAIACALVAGVTGYFLGQAKSLGLFGGSPVAAPSRRSEKEEDSDESSDEEGDAPSEFPGHSEECKPLAHLEYRRGAALRVPHAGADVVENIRCKAGVLKGHKAPWNVQQTWYYIHQPARQV